MRPYLFQLARVCQRRVWPSLISVQVRLMTSKTIAVQKKNPNYCQQISHKIYRYSEIDLHKKSVVTKPFSKHEHCSCTHCIIKILCNMIMNRASHFQILRYWSYWRKTSCRSTRSSLFNAWRFWADRKEQEAQLMLTNPRDAFSGQSWSPNSIVP